MIEYPKLGTPIILGVIGSFCLYLAWVEIWPREAGMFLAVLRALLVIAGLWMIGAAFIAGINLVAYDTGRRMSEIYRARALTERVRLVETVSRMTPEQLAFIGKAQKSTLEFVIGWQGDTFDVMPMELRTQWGNIPVDFIRQFVDQSVDGYTPPIRTWGEGTRERGFAEALVALFTSYGWINPAMGNRSAEWLNYEAAQEMLERMGI
jgi:hypothetical protein